MFALKTNEQCITISLPLNLQFWKFILESLDTEEQLILVLKWNE